MRAAKAILSQGLGIPFRQYLHAASGSGRGDRVVGELLRRLRRVDPDHQVQRLVTSADIRQLALQSGIHMVPNTLAECMVEREPNTGEGAPLAIAGKNSGHLVASVTTASPDTFPAPLFYRLSCGAVGGEPRPA